MDYNSKIKSLQKLMVDNKIDAYIVLTSDPHLSEYIPDYYKSREWLSGFKGSAGVITIIKDRTILWVDGRYSIQAVDETNGVDLSIENLSGINYIEYLSNNLSNDMNLGVDFKVMPLFLEHELNKQLSSRGIKIVDIDLVSSIWSDRPSLDAKKIIMHDDEFCGEASIDRICKISDIMKSHGAIYHLVSSLDDIAWITNLRGSDVEYNPVFLSYLLIYDGQAILFVNVDNISNEAIKKLNDNKIRIMHYDAINEYILNIKDSTFLIDSFKTTAYIASLLQQNNKIIDVTNPSTLLKSMKNKVEIHHTKNVMEQDGVALCYFFMWLEDAIGNKKISELDIDCKLREFRSKNDLYISDSFATIAGFNENAAMPHYRATKDKFSYIQGDGLLLIDSGGQYKNGTTDITRVVAVNNITEEQKRDYTLVLKAHIAMATTIFPNEIPMPLLDSITRVPLWREQIDYIHGTGHGVGYFLNVHEGPQVLSYFVQPTDKTRAKEGMITSIEPGIYRSGKWGVRLENLVLNRLYRESEFGKFLYFDALTLCPFELNCIDTSMLERHEIRWVNDYHEIVYKRLAPHLDKQASNWLKEKTIKIDI